MKKNKFNLITECSLLIVFFLFFTPNMFAAEKITETKTNQQSVKKGIFRVGSAVTDATPKKWPIAVNGGFLPRYLDNAVDPINCRAIMLDDGSESFVFATIDCCLFPASFADAVKKIAFEKAAIPPERISLSATHTHCAPGLYGTLYTDYNKEYIPYLIEKAAETIIKAKENLQPAEFGWSTAREVRHVFCRRFLMRDGANWQEPPQLVDVTQNIAQMNPGKGNPKIISRTGVPDQTIYILSFRKPNGSPIALLTNYSTHYAKEVPGLSADYYGVYAKRIAEMIKAPSEFTPMMTNGTSGDTNCIDFLDKDQPPFDRLIVGEHIAEKVFEAWKNIVYTDKVILKTNAELLTLNNRVSTLEQIKFAENFLAVNKDNPNVPATSKVYAQRCIDQKNAPKTRTFILQVIGINDFGIATIPNEVFSFTGHDIRAYTPFKTNMIIGLANGYNGYLPTTEQFELGGYTTWRGTSYLEKTAEPKIRAKLLVMLHEIYDSMFK